MRIDSYCDVLPGLVPHFDTEILKNEPMLFNCDLRHARGLGGPITRAVLELLPAEWRDLPLVIDSRVHMLMPGWYPCIPGWHHDDVPRTRSDGQPNYAPGQNRSEHIMCLVNGDICPTAFAIGGGEFDEPPLGQVIYEQWHRAVERRLLSGALRLQHAPTNTLVRFGDRTWHAGTASRSNGWRFFIRVSRYTDANGAPMARGNARTNEVRRQVQVYLDRVNSGW